jgi:hypothetical protein
MALALRVLIFSVMITSLFGCVSDYISDRICKAYFKQKTVRTEKAATKAKFKTTEIANVPTGRKGKHHLVVAAILQDLDGLQGGKALKIPLAELPDTIVNVRSALNRVTRKLGKDVATATDDNFLYIWNGSPAQ